MKYFVRLQPLNAKKQFRFKSADNKNKNIQN